jgi:hypothetical protein
MAKEWPPEGYSEPIKWEKSELKVTSIAIITALGLLLVLNSQLSYIGDISVETVLTIVRFLGWEHSTSAILAATIPYMIFILVLLGVFFRFVLIPAHERIHFEVDRYFGINPQYLWTEFIFFNNPSVIPADTHISRYENIVSAIAPALIIGAISISILLITSGLIETLAALVLWVNTATSAGDFYNIIRISLMPRGTLFSNFEVENGEYRVEYVVPQ